MPDSPLSKLARRISEVQEVRNSPLEPEEESRPILPVAAYLDTEDEARLVWELIREIAEADKDVFNLYPEATLASVAIGVLADLGPSATMRELIDQIRLDAAEQGPWLVSTPLVNVWIERPVSRVSDGVHLQRAYLSPAASDREYNEASEGMADIRNLYGESFPPPQRWLTSGSPHASAIDTRRTCSLITLESGTVPIALSRARAKALYALAVWTILFPPEQRSLYPDIGLFVPNPYVHIRQRVVEATAPGNRLRRPNFGEIRLLPDYELPVSPEREIPFSAIKRLEDRRCAQALLSSSRSAFQAAKGSTLLLSERLRQIVVAIECLCESAPGDPMNWDRWEAISGHFRVEEQLRNQGYSPAALKAARERLAKARNVATHGADASLIDLGFPVGSRRPLRGNLALESKDLSHASISADLRALISSVQLVLNEALRDQHRKGWNDAEFEEYFA